jgi:uncharacterized membrane protein (UPF0127 family)
MTCAAATTAAAVRPTLMSLLLLVALTGCQESPQSNLPTVKMKLGSQTFTLEVAADDASRQHGLMQRDSMPAHHGMIFVFPQPERLGFYMKNTRIPLDIVFVGPDRAVVSIKQMRPYDLSTTSSDYPAKWAIELNKGAAGEAGVKVGDVLEIPEAARSTQQ